MFGVEPLSSTVTVLILLVNSLNVASASIVPIDPGITLDPLNDSEPSTNTVEPAVTLVSFPSLSKAMT